MFDVWNNKDEIWFQSSNTQQLSEAKSESDANSSSQRSHKYCITSRPNRKGDHFDLVSFSPTKANASDSVKYRSTSRPKNPHYLAQALQSSNPYRSPSRKKNQITILTNHLFHTGRKSNSLSPFPPKNRRVWLPLETLQRIDCPVGVIDTKDEKPPPEMTRELSICHKVHTDDGAAKIIRSISSCRVFYLTWIAGREWFTIKGYVISWYCIIFA